MSNQYDMYLHNHKENVRKGFEYIRDNLPELLKDGVDYEWQICFNHDKSKDDPEEYNAYDKYFYGNNRSYNVVQDFRFAWLRHIHNNPHHWQYWILINDDPDEGEIIMEMPHLYIIEMICDWWAFSWTKGDLTEIFNFYEKNGKYMKLADKTRYEVEHILDAIRESIGGNNGNNR